jgi:hypothetical protein
MNQNNLKSLKTISNGIIKTNILVLMLLNLFSFVAFSQEKKINTIIQYDEFITLTKSENKKIKLLRIENLINQIQPSIYVESDGVKTYGSQPVSLFTSVKNIPKTKNISTNKENIEIVNIRINTFDDLSSYIDLSMLKGFKKLKYVYIISDIKCSESDIKPIIKNIGEYIVLYKIANNS